ncbi:NurA domain-containing protein, partial [filamentous cyanobacterium CCP5]
VEYIQACSEPERCLVFFDGALVVTFAEVFEAEGREPYVQAMLKLLRASEQYQVPLVGYVDTSYAHDLTTMVHHAAGLQKTERIHDAQILNPLMQWGERIPLHRCDRGGILNYYEEMGNQVDFTYLKTTREGYPARLEIPSWVYKSGRLGALIDRVRAEVVVGGGYPYAIETADQTAVIQSQDRQLFYRIFQDWTRQEDIGLRFSRKMVSKVRRR